MATLFLFTYQLDGGAESAPGDRPGLATYLCLLACAVIVARQIRKRGETHTTLY